MSLTLDPQLDARRSKLLQSAYVENILEKNSQQTPLESRMGAYFVGRHFIIIDATNAVEKNMVDNFIHPRIS